MRRDQQLCVERELALLIRSMAESLYPANSVPASFDIPTLLQLITCEIVAVNQDQYQLKFGQYFRFDVSGNLPYFYRAVHNLLTSVCREVVTQFHHNWIPHKSFTLFDPVQIQSGSDDLRVDSLVATCAVLTTYGIIANNNGGVIQRQHREVTQFFRKRWAGTRETGSGVEDVISLWLSYPCWDRCAEIREVLELVCGICLVSTYDANFVDVGVTAMSGMSYTQVCIL